VTWQGWAIEARINAEDPFAGFVPSPGRIADLRAPGGPWVRDDSGVYAGATVSRYYDTLLAKLIVWGPDREAAIARMTRALAEYHVAGVRTTIPVLARIMRHPDFTAGRLDTGFMERLLAADLPAGGGAHRTPPLPSAGPSAWTRSGRVWPRPR
jgi:acetyl-CoA carboxylase, biotin carboxylase subunit